VVTTTADLTVVPVEDGIDIIYVVDSFHGTAPAERMNEKFEYQPGFEYLNTVREMTWRDIEIDPDGQRPASHLRRVIPDVVANVATAYLVIHEEDKNFKVYLRPTIRLNIDLFEIQGTVDGEFL